MLTNSFIATIYIDLCILLFILTLKATQWMMHEIIFITHASVTNIVEGCVSRIMRETWQVSQYTLQEVLQILLTYKAPDIYMVTQRRQKKKTKTTEDLSVCDSSELNWKNYCGKRHAANAWKTKAMQNYVKTTLLSFNAYQF